MLNQDQEQNNFLSFIKNFDDVNFNYNNKDNIEYSIIEDFIFSENELIDNFKQDCINYLQSWDDEDYKNNYNFIINKIKKLIKGA
jgi:hypothetical protein